MDGDRIYSCDMILADGGRWFELDLVVAAKSYAAVADAAVQYAAKALPSANIDEMNIQTQKAVISEAAGIQYNSAAHVEGVRRVEHAFAETPFGWIRKFIGKRSP